MGASDLSDIASDLDNINERLSDIALDLLRQALGDSDPKASPTAKAEKIVTRARRSVEKARHLLNSLEIEDR